MYVVFPSQYLFAATLGLIAGLRSRYVREEKARAKLRRAQTSSPQPAFMPPVPRAEPA
jgi:hypothetical protein